MSTLYDDHESIQCVEVIDNDHCMHKYSAYKKGNPF